MRRVLFAPRARTPDAERATLTWALLLLVFVCSVPLFISVGTLSATQERVRWATIGAPGDTLRVGGMYAPEGGAGRQWRWTTGDASLSIPLPAGSAGHRWRVDLHLTNPGSRARNLLIYCGPVKQSVPLDAAFGDLFVTFDCPSRSNSIALRFNVDPVRLPADGRALGVAVRAVNVGALDSDIRWLWRLRMGLSLAALLTGTVAALYAVSTRPWVLIPLGGLLLANVVICASDSPWRIALSTPRPALLTLATGMLAHLLAHAPPSRRSRLTVLLLALLLPLIALAVPDPSLPLLAAKPWTVFDADARALLPWLSVVLGVAAVALGGARAQFLAALGCVVAVGTNLGMPVLGVLAQRWAVSLTLPDWSSPVSIVGGVLLAALACSVLVGVYVAQCSPRLMPLRVATLLAIALTVLIPWRVQTMLLNGDEPHYAVLARSMVDDADLDPLDDYASRDYRAVVYSPDGNIAADRGDGIDRAAAVWAPTAEPGWLLLPPGDLALAAAGDDDSGALLRSSRTSLLVRSPAGHLDALPPLIAGTELAVVMPMLEACEALSLLIAPVTPAEAPPSLQITRINSPGTSTALPAPVWRGGVGRIDLSSGDVAGDCRGQALGFLIASDVPVVAQVVAHGSSLRVIPATPASTVWQLGPLPRDPLGGDATTAYLALLNPGTSEAIVTLQVLAATADVAFEQQIRLTAGEVTRIGLPVGAGSAVSIAASAPVAATLVSWLPAGAYVAPQLQVLTDWHVAVDVPTARLAGVDVIALSLDGPATLTGNSSSYTLCAPCAVTLPLRDPVVLSASAGSVLVGGVQMEERSDGLHYDLLLPALAAGPSFIDFPWGALAVPALSGLLIALGLLWLLRRVGAGYAEWPQAAVLLGAVGAVLLAPVSPFLVRIYTESVAAALLMGAVVCLAVVAEASGMRRWSAAAGVVLIAALLPTLHGRYLPLAGMLLVLLLWETTRTRRRLLLLAIPGAAAALLLLMALSPFTVALQERGSPSYLSTEWLPHNLVGMLLDRGSGLLVWAPWCLLAVACPRQPLTPIQRNALLLITTQASVTMLRAGGWQTFSPPARYLLPVVPLLALFAVPGAVRLWQSQRLAARGVVVALLGLSVCTTALLHWVPQVGYALPPVYPLDTLAAELPLVRLLTLAPRISPGTSLNLLGGVLLILCWGAVAHLLRSPGGQDPRTNADFQQKSH